MTIPRCLYQGVPVPPDSARLIGFCDASSKAYAAVVYMRIESEESVDVKFIAAKTRVAPAHGGVTIPRLELLSAVLLSKLITSVHSALESELQLDDVMCFTDSKVSLYWIQGVNHEWKQFVENRANTIRTLVPHHQWKHCPGKENPADIPSRGASPTTLIESSLWLQGPEWLSSRNFPLDSSNVPIETEVPGDCQCEMKKGKLTHSLVAGETHVPNLSQVILPERYSSSHRLFRVTALVLKFISRLRGRHDHARPPSPPNKVLLTKTDIDKAKLTWIKDVQSRLQEDKRFCTWKQQLGLFVDGDGVWRCGGRMSNSCLTAAEQNPILLDKNHYLTTLIVVEAHKRVLHNGVKDTLAELRSAYWLVRGRQFVRKLIHSCVTCRKFALPGYSLSTFARISCCAVSAVSDYCSGFCWTTVC